MSTEIQSPKDLTVKFKHIDNRVVLKADGNTIWDATFHGGNEITVKQVIPHRGKGTSTKVRVEIYNKKHPGPNPWGISFRINSTPKVKVDIRGDGHNENDLRQAWDYNFNWV